MEAKKRKQKRIQNLKKPQSPAATRSRVKKRSERIKTFPKTLPGDEINRKCPKGHRKKYLHRKIP